MAIVCRERSSLQLQVRNEQRIALNIWSIDHEPGHSILHELTHLDSLAKQAGLGPKDNQHGTDDSQEGAELGGARDHLKKYKKDKDEPSPDYNTESYAAAATGMLTTNDFLLTILTICSEKHFMDLCDFKEIKPLVKTEEVPSPENPKLHCVGNPSDGPEVAFGQAEADAAILDFYGNKNLWNTVLVPSVSFDSGRTNDGRGKALAANNNVTINGGDATLWIQLSFSEEHCSGMFQFTYGKDDDEKLSRCADHFRTVLNDCNTAGLYPKFGGELRDVCAVYRLGARKADGVDPFPLKSQGDKGKFTCKDT